MRGKAKAYGCGYIFRFDLKLKHIGGSFNGRTHLSKRCNRGSNPRPLAMTALKVPLSKITRTFNIAEMEKKSLARVITLKSVMAVITSAPIWSYHLMARI